MADGGFTTGSGYIGGFTNPQDPQNQGMQAGQGAQYTAQPVQAAPQPVQPVQQDPASMGYGMPTGTYDPNAYAQPVQPVASPVYQQPAPQPMPQQAPMGAYDPYAAPMGQAQPAQQGAGAPLAGMGDAAGGTQPPFDPNYKFGERMKDFTTSVKLPEHTVKVDEANFLNLLAGSISLTKEEKKKIVDSFAKLRQEQVDELIRIFEEERAKFIELSPKHGAQLKKLEDEHAADWKDIEISYTAAAKKEEEDAKAEAIRKQLGLN